VVKCTAYGERRRNLREGRALLGEVGVEVAAALLLQVLHLLLEPGQQLRLLRGGLGHHLSATSSLSPHRLAWV
jgi:hypothetical protein